MTLLVEKLHAHIILAAVLLLLSGLVYGLRKCRGNRGTALLQVAQTPMPPSLTVMAVVFTKMNMV